MVYWYEIIFLGALFDVILLVVKKKVCENTNIGLYLLRKYWKHRDAN